MSDMVLAINHNGTIFMPPVESGIKIDWERTGSPGKMTFTIVKPSNGDVEFQEGDPVYFEYKNKPVFAGYIFTKKRDRENHIDVTCYDQMRYLKNKYTYVFENKTATQIIKALCADFNLPTGNMDNTKYVIPAIAEENSAAIDICLSVLEETLTNTGELYTLYDDCGTLQLKNCANMISTTLIMKDTAENFNYSSSIDTETYNNVILYYKNDDNTISLYTATDKSKVKQWGELRYFEEVTNKTIAQNKANSLLKLYCRKTRDLKINGAFGDPTVRGGTMIPIQLDLGDTVVNNYMLVDKVTHTFEKDYYTMDLTVSGYWEKDEVKVTTNGTQPTPTPAPTPAPTPTGGNKVGNVATNSSKEPIKTMANVSNYDEYTKLHDDLVANYKAEAQMKLDMEQYNRPEVIASAAFMDGDFVTSTAAFMDTLDEMANTFIEANLWENWFKK